VILPNPQTSTLHIHIVAPFGEKYVIHIHQSGENKFILTEYKIKLPRDFFL